MARTYKDLKKAMAEVATKVKKERKFEGLYDQLAEANDSAYTLFTDPNPVYRAIEPEGRPINITGRALWRTNRYMRRNGIDWPLFDWEALLQWLYENWEKILGLLLTLLMFI